MSLVPPTAKRMPIWVGCNGALIRLIWQKALSRRPRDIIGRDLSTPLQYLPRTRKLDSKGYLAHSMPNVMLWTRCSSWHASNAYGSSRKPLYPENCLKSALNSAVRATPNFENKTETWIKLLDSTREKKAEDARDRIFALIRLAEGETE
jgi:hypothetical protein